MRGYAFEVPHWPWFGAGHLFLRQIRLVRSDRIPGDERRCD